MENALGQMGKVRTQEQVISSLLASPSVITRTRFPGGHYTC